MRDFLFEFIKKIGNKKEFNLFLDLFKKVLPTKFAVIKISGATLENHIDLIAQDIAFLNKLEIYPIIVHGAGTELDKQLPNSKKLNGFRITEKEDLGVIEDVFNTIGNKLTEKINSYGGRAEKTDIIFNCDRLKEYGYVGEIKSVENSKIEDIVKENKTAIISPLGICEESILNINADTAAKEVIKSVVPYKIIILTETGGILDEEGNIISFLNPQNLSEMSNITGGMLLKIKEITELIERNDESSVVITSAPNLLKEMFTVKGSGTFIKSYSIKTTADINTIDKEKIKGLLEGSFNKKLEDNFFDMDIIEIIYDKNYEGVAIIKDVDGIPYLDKLAVAKHRQETGLGGCLWSEVVKKYPKLTWRATPQNPFNAFYFKQCTGCMKFSNWNVFWINLKKEEVFGVVKNILNLPTTMIKCEEK